MGCLSSANGRLDALSDNRRKKKSTNKKNENDEPTYGSCKLYFLIVPLSSFLSLKHYAPLFLLFFYPIIQSTNTHAPRKNVAHLPFLLTFRHLDNSVIFSIPCSTPLVHTSKYNYQQPQLCWIKWQQKE